MEHGDQGKTVRLRKGAKGLQPRLRAGETGRRPTDKNRNQTAQVVGDSTVAAVAVANSGAGTPASRVAVEATAPIQESRRQEEEAEGRRSGGEPGGRQQKKVEAAGEGETSDCMGESWTPGGVETT